MSEIFLNTENFQKQIDRLVELQWYTVDFVYVQGWRLESEAYFLRFHAIAPYKHLQVRSALPKLTSARQWSSGTRPRSFVGLYESLVFFNHVSFLVKSRATMKTGQKTIRIFKNVLKKLSYNINVVRYLWKFKKLEKSLYLLSKLTPVNFEFFFNQKILLFLAFTNIHNHNGTKSSSQWKRRQISGSLITPQHISFFLVFWFFGFDNLSHME